MITRIEILYSRNIVLINNDQMKCENYEIIWLFCMKLWFKVSVTLRKLIPKSKSDEFAENFELELLG